MSKNLIVKFPLTKVKGNNREERIKNIQDAMNNIEYLNLIKFEKEIMTITEIKSKDMIIKINKGK